MSEKSTTGRPKILVIDDEPDICELFQGRLSGCDVTTATNAEEALAILSKSENVFQLIFCDINMPHMNGTELYQSVKNRFPGRERCFVFITGGVASEKINAFLRSVGNPTVPKPINFEIVKMLVKA